MKVRAFLLTLLGLFAAACAGGAALKLDPSSQSFYDNARLVMSDQEKAVFTHLPDQESRDDFIKDFWLKRDPDPETEVNEFKDEFEARIDHANKRFHEGRRGLDTDRGRIYVYLGPPEKEDYYPNEGETNGDVLVWLYYSYDVGIVFVDNNKTGTYVIQQVQGNLFEAIEEAKLGASVKEGSKFIRFDFAYDKTSGKSIVTIPAQKLSFKSEEGRLQADFDFTFYLYAEGESRKRMSHESRTFSADAADVEKHKTITFEFALEIPPGKTYVDVILVAKDNGKARRIFTVRT